MKINILNVIGALNTGGSETMLVNILRTIDKNRFNMYYLCYSGERFDYEEDVNKLGGKIIRIGSLQEVGVNKFISSIKGIIKKYKIDVVHCHTYYNSAFAVIAAKRCGVKSIIVHSHSTKSESHPSIVKRLYFGVSKRVIRKYTTCRLACGKEAGEAMFASDDFIIFENGIVSNDYRFNPAKRKQIRNSLGILDSTKVFGHIGRFSEEKNHKFLVKAFSEYCKKNKDSLLVLMGQGRLMSQIRKQVNDLEMNEKVMFLGLRKDAKDIYNALDVFVLPSLYEGLPLVLVEAQTNGLTILASDKIDKAVDMTGHIQFIPIDDEKKWANGMSIASGRRNDSFGQLSHSKYNMENSVKMLEKLYSEVFE